MPANSVPPRKIWSARTAPRREGTCMSTAGLGYRESRQSPRSQRASRVEYPDFGDHTAGQDAQERRVDVIGGWPPVVPGAAAHPISPVSIFVQRIPTRLGARDKRAASTAYCASSYGGKDLRMRRRAARDGAQYTLELFPMLERRRSSARDAHPTWAHLHGSAVPLLVRQAHAQRSTRSRPRKPATKREACLFCGARAGMDT